MKRKSSDSRFDEIASNPKFRKMRSEERKVVVDERFHSIFHHPTFTLEYSVDKRGRPINKSAVDQMSEYYQIEKPQSSQEVEEGAAEEAEHEIHLDLARGDGNVSSSDAESDDVSINYDVEQLEQPWAQLDSNAPRMEDGTNRIAVCNIDWNKVNSKDIYLLFNSFKPNSGSINKVTIYTSQFGEDKLKNEEAHGPVLETEDDNDDADCDSDHADDIDNKHKEEILNEATRKYEFDRLQYYYAVVECDCVATAESIYKECDGAEYELSGTKLDLRFVPDDTSFEDRPVKEVCNGIEDLANYEPEVFRNSALSSSNVKVTWEEPDPQRTKMALQAFNAKTFDNDHFNDLIASGSDEDNEDASVYKNLLDNDRLEDGEESNLSDPSSATEDNSQARNVKERGEDDGLTSQDRRKERRKQRKALMKQKKKEKLAKKTVGEDEGTDNLELLTEGGTTKKQNYSLRKLVNSQTNDEFNVDVTDDRFNAVFNNPQYNLDPSDPAYKDTLGTRAIVNEKLKRSSEKNQLSITPATSQNPLSGVNLDSLRIKSKKIMDRRNKNVKK